jgi:hypothetical protein
MGRWRRKAPEGRWRWRYPRARSFVAPDEMPRVISACFVIALCLLTACTPAPPQPLITVPNVVGAPVPQAETELESLGLQSEIRVGPPSLACSILRPSPRTPTVLAQTPAPGNKVGTGTVIVLTRLYEC